MSLQRGIQGEHDVGLVRDAFSSLSAAMAPETLMMRTATTLMVKAMTV